MENKCCILIVGHVGRVAVLQCIIRGGKIQIFVFRFGDRTYCDGWKRYFPYRCRLLGKAHDNWTHLPFGVQIPNQNAAHGQRQNNGPDPPNSTEQ